MKLYQHQEKAISLARQFSNIALFHETGTGKTATLIKILEDDFASQSRPRSVLIFALQSACLQWKQEFKKFSNINQDSILVLTETGKKRAQRLQERLTVKLPTIVITNYESVQIKQFYEVLLKWNPEILVCDESHALKNSHAKRTEKIFPLAYGAKRRFIMTGTPIPNSHLDIFGQYKILDSNIFGGNFYSFRNTYFEDKNVRMPKHLHFPDWQPKSGTSEKLGQIISRSATWAKKTDCLDLPPLQQIEVSIKLSDKQQKAYDLMAKYLVAELNGATTIAPIAMTKLIRLQQIVSGFIQDGEDEKKTEWFEENPKMQALKDLLESLGGQRVIMWTTFQPTDLKIGDACKVLGRNPTYITGLQTVTEKQQAMEAFKAGAVDTLIANPGAGGASINLQEAQYAIFYSKGYNGVHFEQSQARNYRSGSEVHDKVVHYHLVATNTIDEIISKALIDKKSVGEEVLYWAKKMLTVTQE